MMLDRRTIEICTKKKSFFNMSINKTNIDLHSVLGFWLNSSKDYQTIVSSIQRETGIRNEHSLHGEIVLYVTQLESISFQSGIGNAQKYAYPLDTYSSAKVHK